MRCDDEARGRGGTCKDAVDVADAARQLYDRAATGWTPSNDAKARKTLPSVGYQSTRADVPFL
jgi:hypothetical protein